MTTEDRFSVIVEADSPEEALSRVKQWGEGLAPLTGGEEATEELEKEHGIIDAQFSGVGELSDVVPLEDA